LAAFHGVSGLRDIGPWATCAALGYNVTGTTFALPALGGDTQLELDLVEAHACACMAGNFAIRNPVADADDHVIGLLVKRCLIINANLSHLQYKFLIFAFNGSHEGPPSCGDVQLHA
jgi:hypothetical protein